MNTENPNTYKIIYSNHFEFEGVKLAFRKGELFDLTFTPRWIPFNGSFWIVKRKQLTKLKAKSLIVMKPIEVDVSNLQWYRQIELDECFNLN